MFKWFWNWLDGLDGNVDGAVFGLGKAVNKLDKAIAANERQAAAQHTKQLELEDKAKAAGWNVHIYSTEANRAKRIKTKVEELLK